jgi:Mg/Co/Ni transporter MgtE (contains CBS domain)
MLKLGKLYTIASPFVVTMQTPNSNSSTLRDVSRRELRDLVRAQLQSLLEVGDLRGAKAILVPVQPVDIAEAIEGLPEAMHAIAFRLLSKDEAIEVCFPRTTLYKND